MISDAVPTVPFHVFTGFLGSGKTTLLRQLLAEPGGERIAVLVNEVGDIGLDHLLLERVDEDVMLMAGGCICCALREDLRTTIEAVLARGATRVILETTGLADPAPILHTFGHDEVLQARLTLTSVVCVVDAPRAEDLLAQHPEASRQLAFCDRVVITKTDESPADRVSSVHDLVERHAPGIDVATSILGNVDRGWLLGPIGTTRGPRFRPADWLAPAHNSFSTLSRSTLSPVALEPLMLWLRLVTQIDGPALLRVKGLVRDGTGGAWMFQSANRTVSPPIRIDDVHDSRAGADVVLIVRDMSQDTIEALLASLDDAFASRLV